MTILDAYRMLVRNGPSGGNIADVVLKKMVIASTDPVAVDSYGATLFNMLPENVDFLQEATRRGLGQSNLNKLNIKTVTVSSS